MVFCDTLFSIILWRFIGEMYEGERMDFKIVTTHRDISFSGYPKIRVDIKFTLC